MDDDLGIRLGRRIRELREAAQLTQAELAKLALKSVETISNFERGKTIPSLQTLSALARDLGVPIATFFEDVPVKQSSDPLGTSIMNKCRLLDNDDKELVAAFVQLLSNRRGSSTRR